MIPLHHAGSQAEHAGSIPVIRSTTNAQVSTYECRSSPSSCPSPTAPRAIHVQSAHRDQSGGRAVLALLVVITSRSSLLVNEPAAQ